MAILLFPVPIELDNAARLPLPIAIQSLFKTAFARASVEIPILLLVLTILLPTFVPSNTQFEAVVNARPALKPAIIFAVPVVIALPPCDENTQFSEPVVSDVKAASPNPILFMPVKVVLPV